MIDMKPSKKGRDDDRMRNSQTFDRKRKKKANS